MTEQSIVDLIGRTMWVTMLIAAPVLISTLLIGLVVSVFQAATQINEQTLSFIPKVIVMTVALIFFGPWIIQTLLHFTRDVFNGIPNVTR